MTDGTETTQDINELLELLDGISVLVNTGVAIGADKQVNASDLTHVVGLLNEVSTIVDAVKGLKELPAEVKDLDQNEVLQLGARVFEMVKDAKTVYENNKGA
jgi:hypothetical protein